MGHGWMPIAFDVAAMAQDALDQGLTPRAWAELAGVTPRTVRRFVTGETASLDTGSKLAQALGRKPSAYTSRKRRR